MLKLFMQRYFIILNLIIFNPNGAIAQGLFDTIITVDKAAITKYELEQRIRFFSFLNEPGDPEIKSREGLINDRLKMAAAKKVNLQLTPAVIENSMKEFAKNSGRSLEQLFKLLEGGGVDPETFRDYVEAGITWRELIRKRFASRGEPTDAEIDRAIRSASPKGGMRVLLTEIVLPAQSEQLESARKISKELVKIKSVDAFSEQALRLSISNSRDVGGRLPWKNSADLPNGLRQIILGLRPGDVTPPLEVKNAIVLFQLRDIEEIAIKEPKIVTIKYIKITGDEPQLDLAAKSIDACENAYGLVKGNANLSMTIVSQKPGEIDQAIFQRLNSLDSNEISIFSSESDEKGTIIMLCERTYANLPVTSREEIKNKIMLDRLTNLANGYLSELKSNATIIIK